MDIMDVRTEESKEEWKNKQNHIGQLQNRGSKSDDQY